MAAAPSTRGGINSRASTRTTRLRSTRAPSISKRTYCCRRAPGGASKNFPCPLPAALGQRPQKYGVNRVIPGRGSGPAPIGFVTSALAASYLEHALDQLGLSGVFPILKLGITYPLDPALIDSFAGAGREPGRGRGATRLSRGAGRAGAGAASASWASRLPVRFTERCFHADARGCLPRVASTHPSWSSCWGRSIAELAAPKLKLDAARGWNASWPIFGTTRRSKSAWRPARPPSARAARTAIPPVCWAK